MISIHESYVCIYTDGRTRLISLVGQVNIILEISYYEYFIVYLLFYGIVLLQKV